MCNPCDRPYWNIRDDGTLWMQRGEEQEWEPVDTSKEGLDAIIAEFFTDYEEQ